MEINYAWRAHTDRAHALQLIRYDSETSWASVYCGKRELFPNKSDEEEAGSQYINIIKLQYNTANKRNQYTNEYHYPKNALKQKWSEKT